MPTYKLTAKRQMGKIPKGFFIQVPSPSSTPMPAEVEKAIIAAGFTDPISWGYKSAGN